MDESKDKSPGYGRVIAWAIAAVVVLPVVYVLSSGPAAAIVVRYAPEYGGWWDVIYGPLTWLVDTPVFEPLYRYIHWWTGVRE